jgi:hypothetical protein
VLRRPLVHGLLRAAQEACCGLTVPGRRVTFVADPPPGLGAMTGWQSDAARGRERWSTAMAPGFDHPKVAEAIVRPMLPGLAEALASEVAPCRAIVCADEPSDDLATWSAQRYVADVRSVGGLKLSVEGAARDDRRARFANVSLAATDAEDDVALVTDSQGRMRYRLPDGEYLLRMADLHESRFTVRDGRWTTVRIRLP